MELDRILKEDSFASDPEASVLLKNLFRLQQTLRDITFKKFGRINPLSEDLTDWKERGEFYFGKGKNITVYNSTSIAGRVSVGKDTWIGPFAELDGTGGLEIGENCSISANVYIATHDTVKWALSGGKHPYEYAPVAIGDNCFLGNGAIINKGLKIGKHCLIGAGAVVTKDIPDYSIALGVPARIVGKVEVDGATVNLRYF